MEKVTKLPEDFLDDLNLSGERLQIFLGQINRFNLLREKPIINNDVFLDDEGNVLFPEGTIIFGTRRVTDLDKINKIAETGIKTGQAVGVHEDGETFYCADFFRVPKTISIKEYGENFNDNFNFTPFDRSKNSMALIIQPNEELAELQSYDCFRDGTVNSDKAKQFVNMKGLFKKDVKRTEASSILYGIPSNAISGIVLGDNHLVSKDFFDHIRSIFPNCYIVTKRGGLIYDPSKEFADNIEFSETKRQLYNYQAKEERLAQDIMEKEEKLALERQKYNGLYDSLFKILQVEDIAKILGSNGWQITKELIESIKQTKAELLENEKTDGFSQGTK